MRRGGIRIQCFCIGYECIKVCWRGGCIGKRCIGFRFSGGQLCNIFSKIRYGIG